MPYCQLLREEDRDQRLILKGYDTEEEKERHCFYIYFSSVNTFFTSITRWQALPWNGSSFEGRLSRLIQLFFFMCVSRLIYENKK